MGAIFKKERERIFKLFSRRVHIRFTEIEKALKMRSNALAYYLNVMQEEGFIEKRGKFYRLTKQGEQYLPILAQKTVGPLPIVLVAVKNNNKMLLLKRNNRPYKGYWGLLGGKVEADETIEQASIRLTKEKSGLSTTFISTHSIALEHVKQEESIKHSFLLIFTEVKAENGEINSSEYGHVNWFSLQKLSKQIIPSDLWLIKNKMKQKIDIGSVILQEKSGKIIRIK